MKLGKHRSERVQKTLRRSDHRGPTRGFMSVHQCEATDRRWNGEVPGVVDVHVGAVDLVMLDPRDVWQKIAQDNTTERDVVADVRRLVVQRLREDRRMRKHRYNRPHPRQLRSTGRSTVIK